ncbi:hypothetical protein KC678_05395 [Candidatus Dojkabacteria bacterium]|uniref:Uncharacterized protein n=1 Tax=Candidatus Dojkabacteria bacterium TaxID=2099670 RepID=A0A955RHT7_9BACT|nr:hypothetical protein [Candidatus Dojkabacteria bacterium]
MKRYSFDLGTTTLEILTNDLINSEDLDTVFKLIQFVRYDFNHIIHNSSAYRLNSAGIDTPVLVTPEFRHYLKINISEADKSKHDFMPFYRKNGVIEKNAISNIIEIEDNIATKKSEILFKSNLLLQAYLIDLIFENIKSLKIKSFLLHTKNFARSFGTNSWDVTLEIESGENYTTKLINKSIGVHNITQSEKRKIPDTFANKDMGIEAVYTIVPSVTCIDSKIIASRISKIFTESALKRFAKENSQEFILVDSDLRIHKFED